MRKIDDSLLASSFAKVFIITVNHWASNPMSAMESFKTDAQVVEFINGLIDVNFPRSGAPAWVNYDLFHQERFQMCVECLVDNLCVGVSQYDDHALAFGYTSELLDTGASSAHGAVDDFTTVDVPDHIQKLYMQKMSVVCAQCENRYNPDGQINAHGLCIYCNTEFYEHVSNAYTAVFGFDANRRDTMNAEFGLYLKQHGIVNFETLYASELWNKYVLFFTSA